MITAETLNLVETTLDAKVEAHVVPETEAYPTSGSTFIRVSGDYTDIQFREQSVQFTVGFTVSCSIRTRDFLTQNKRIPYVTLLNLQERCFFIITQDLTLVSGLSAIAERISVSGRFTSSVLNTKVQNVYPDFFGSTDLSSTREAGYMLSQSYVSPKIIIPMECLAFPAPLTEA